MAARCIDRHNAMTTQPTVAELRTPGATFCFRGGHPHTDTRPIRFPDGGVLVER
jgi:hypothetical protein